MTELVTRSFADLMPFDSSSRRNAPSTPSRDLVSTILAMSALFAERKPALET